MAKCMYPPPPERSVVKDLGVGFLTGGAFSSVYYFIRGARVNLKRGLHEVCTKSPVQAGQIAVLCGLSTLIESAVICIRGGKEDPWDSIISVGPAVGLFVMHKGVRVASLSALGFAGAYVCLRGASLAAQRTLAKMKLEALHGCRSEIASPSPTR